MLAADGRRRWAVVGGILLGLTLAGTLVFLAVQPPGKTDHVDCPGADPALAAVLNMNAAAIRSACAQGDGFMSALRTELASHLRDRSLLWRSGLESADSPKALDAWRQGGLVSLPGGAAWSVPLEPDWTEDPYSNLSWLTGYHSLAWLTTLARGYREGDHALGDDLKHYLLSWIDANPIEQPPSVRSWYNGAVHRRTNALVDMWDVLVKVLDDDQLATVLVSLHEHGAQLDSYLSNPRFYGHNHNLFQALSLLNLAKEVPELADAVRWQQDARDRMHSLLREMVDPEDAVSTEQASGYHYVAMSLFLAAQQYLASDGDGLEASDLALLTDMTRFGALLPDPAGTLPAIGDTKYGSDDARAMGLLGDYGDLGLITPEAEYVLTRGRSGRRPADASFFPGEGYAIFRPSYGEAGTWEDDLHVVVDMGPNARVHGHNDAMNVLLAAFGQQLLVDSGGPYQYGVEDRQAFTDASAHNTVLVDGQSYEAGDATVEHMLDDPRFSLITGTRGGATGVRHRRTVLVVKPWLVLVIDDLRASDGQEHRFDLLYHLPPESDVSLDGSGAMVRAGGAALGLTVASSNAVSSVVRRGETDPLFGWVTTGISKRSAAPVLDFSQQVGSAWFVTAILPSPVSAAMQPRVTAHQTGNGLQIEVSAGESQWAIFLPDDGEPVVEP